MCYYDDIKFYALFLGLSLVIRGLLLNHSVY